MGWLYTYETATPEDIKRKFTTPWTDQNGTVHQVTDARWGSAHTLWGIYRENGTPVEIHLWLVNHGKEEWG